MCFSLDIKLSLKNEINLEADTKCLPLSLSLQPNNIMYNVIFKEVC